MTEPIENAGLPEQTVIRPFKALGEENWQAVVQRWPQLDDPARKRQYVLRKWIGRLDLLWVQRAKDQRVHLYFELLRVEGIGVDRVINSGLPMRRYLCDLAKRGRWTELEALGIEPIAATQELWVTPSEFFTILNRLAHLRLGVERTFLSSFLLQLPSTADNWILLPDTRSFLVKQLLDPLKLAGLVRPRRHNNWWCWAIRPAYLAPGELRTLLEAEARRRQDRYWNDSAQRAKAGLERQSRSSRYRWYAGPTRRDQKEGLENWILQMVKRRPLITTQELQQLLACFGRKVTLRTVRHYRQRAVQKLKDDRISEANAAEERHD